ncbi:MAG TPA: hypothetical protein VF337_01100 [Candidatus Limnocylindrales bacterium]
MKTGRRIIAIIPVWAQPTALALVFALVALPIVVLGWDVGFRSYYINTGAFDPTPARWTAAAVGVFLPALVAGPIGGLVVRRNVLAAALFTFVLSLIVAVEGAAFVPSFLGGQGDICVGANIGSPCDPITAVAHIIIDDIQALPLLLFFAPFAEPVALLTLALGVAVWAIVLPPGRAVAEGNRVTAS